MKSAQQKRTSRFGFTMIELLIVIAILGVLAVAVLAAINPLEQINKSRDTSNQSDAEQLLGAVDRYYANNEFYPWQVDATSNAALTTVTDVTSTWADGGATTVLTKLSTTAQELKASYVQRISGASYNRLKVYYNPAVSGAAVYICFSGKSTAFKTKAAARCTGTLPGDLAGANSTICGAGNEMTCLP